MKITINQGDLNKGMAIVTRVVATRGQLPVLANVLLEAGKEGMVLAATNLELGIRVGVGGKVTQEGKTTVPARTLAEFVGSLPEGVVELMAEGEKLKVKARGYEGEFLGIAAAEFPALPGVGEKENKRVKVKKEMVEEIAREVAFAAATDESRPVLTGVKLEVAGDQLVATATDGFRLSRKTVEMNMPGSVSELIIPARTVVELARILGEAKGGGEGGGVTMEVVGDGSQVIFAYGKVELVSRVLQGNFPDVEKIIPREQKTRVVADREELTRAVRAAAIFARESSNIVRFNVQGSMLKIKAAASQSGESEIEMEVEKEGEDEEMAFNYRYVMDFLNSAEAERVILLTSGPMAPGVWKVEKNESLTHLIMPVRV